MQAQLEPKTIWAIETLGAAIMTQPSKQLYVTQAGKLGAHLVSNVVYAEGHFGFLELTVWLILVLRQETGMGLQTCKPFAQEVTPVTMYDGYSTRELMGQESNTTNPAVNALRKDGTGGASPNS